MTVRPQMELVSGVFQRMLPSIAALAITNVAGAHGYPHARNGRGSKGTRRRSTNTAETATAENSTTANPV